MISSLRTRTTNRTVFSLSCAALLALAGPAMAQSDAKDAKKDAPASGAKQPEPAPSPYRSRPVRKPVIDLQQMAKERRPGQVMPGDPAPMAATPAPVSTPPASTPIPAAAPTAASPVPAVKLPDTAPPTKPVLGPRVDGEPTPRASNAGVVTDIGTRPGELAPGVPEAVAQTPAAPPTTAAAIPPGEDPTAVPLVETAIVKNPAMPLSTGPARVRVESVNSVSGVEWRADAGQWHAPTAGETIEGRVEVRVALDSELVLVVDDRVQVKASRLSRLLLERDVEPGGVTSVGLILARGAVEVGRAQNAPAASGPNDMFARVRTPDQTFGVTGPLRIEYDAFTGTRRRVVQ